MKLHYLRCHLFWLRGGNDKLVPSQAYLAP
jgi:hypothetical protein